MCTAVNLTLNHHFFGRNLDLDRDYGVSGVTTPENYRLNLRNTESVTVSYAIIGAGIVSDGFPLYFDAMNRSGLCAAGLNFPACAVYRKVSDYHINITSFELIPYVLSQCKDTSEALELLKRVNITDDCFNEQLPATPLHWIFADKNNTVIAEPLENGLNLIMASTGVLTNSPEYAVHLNNLKSYTDLSPKAPREDGCCLNTLGTGSDSLPGGLSSEARFIRASFFKESARKGTEAEERSDFFAILAAATVPCGSVLSSDGKLHYTRYSSCCDTKNGVYMYKSRTSLIPEILFFEEISEGSDEIKLTIFY